MDLNSQQSRVKIWIPDSCTHTQCPSSPFRSLTSSSPSDQQVRAFVKHKQVVSISCVLNIFTRTLIQRIYNICKTIELAMKRCLPEEKQPCNRSELTVGMQNEAFRSWIKHGKDSCFLLKPGRKIGWSLSWHTCRMNSLIILKTHIFIRIHVCKMCPRVSKLNGVTVTLKHVWVLGGVALSYIS